MAQADVIIENEQSVCGFTPEMETAIRQVVDMVLEQEGFAQSCEVSVLIVDDAAIQALNKEHRGKDAATDVLSFPMLEFDAEGRIVSADEAFGGALLLGDIVISLPHAYAQAEEYGHSPLREVGFLCAHSMLHLLGYDHEQGEAERRVMREKEEKALAALGLVR
ncbi:MAG TPA: rRNA maturation RNase YbeY [Candidatus Aphodoplasma excrementigallinarum]|uniref:Endoribonuclease YbeY n=1 Tax=Candidatus Aphodoplasma excrementigallinarum TaxID=2840673 RepID=A0A9D1T0A3_9FIRM|nr:rRNA maturation RNase YbeY [Candidatus Aphodoplasma excrementigallinarum]